jgi:uncharacterized protein
MHTNRLSGQQSPYLQQHAHNPVDWYPWGGEAFEKARRENKPIFLSIGYSTCHWCHVMERESFENEQVAAILNESFVAIKVDREERPDVDRIYMAFVQATTGGGGWPLSVWLTPERQPFFGGTYFPPEARYGHPGFSDVLRQLAAAWQTGRAQILESAGAVISELQRHTAVVPATAGAMRSAGRGTLDSGFAVLRRTFDTRQGGFGEAPKFPRPAVYNFLLRYYARTGNREALDMVLLTLQRIALGGMTDQLSGGFHRYSVDERWFVPHFEKMLYDQAQLAVSFIEAFQITSDPAYADVARVTLAYVLRDMTGPEGGFYSAEDADSVIDPAQPGEKGEGAFYVWTEAEIRALAASPAADWLCYHYGVEPDGNVANDPHHEFAGKNILYHAHTLEEAAEHFGRDPQDIQAGVLEAERALLAARAQRTRPHLDDKVLTAWNGLTISALAKGGAVLGSAVYADAARRAATFIVATLYQPETGILLRRYRGGEAAIPGFLDDYAFFVQGLLDLYEAQFDLAWLELAVRLTEKQLELFEDREHGGFFSTAAGDESLVLRMKEDYDGAEPSGNSIAALNLLRLAQMTGRTDFRTAAERTLAAFGSRLSGTPAGVPQMLAVYEFSQGTPQQVVIAGERGAADTEALLATVHARFSPFQTVLLAAGEETRRKLAEWVPAVATMGRVNGRAAAYVCENYTCQLPVTEPVRLGELLQ